MNKYYHSRRKFIKTTAAAAIGSSTLGVKIEKVSRSFVRPTVYPWEAISNQWGVKEI